MAPFGGRRSRTHDPSRFSIATPLWVFITTVAVFSTVVFLLNARNWKIARQGVDLATFRFPEAWPLILSDPSRVSLVLGSALLVLILATELSWHEPREEVIDDLSKDEWFVSKLLETLMVCLFYEAMVLGTGALFASSNPHTTFMRHSDVQMIGSWSLGLLGFASFGFLLATTIRRPAPAFSILLLWVSVGEDLIHRLVASKSAPDTSLARFLPGNVFFELMEPRNFDAATFESAQRIAAAAGKPLPVIPDMHVLTLVAVGYIVAFFTISYLEMHLRRL